MLLAKFHSSTQMKKHPWKLFIMEEYEDSTLLEKLDTEKQLLGFYVSGHPMDMYKEAWTRSVTVNLNSPEENPHI